MIVHGDILEWAASYEGPKFHALLCDPPYHLTADHRGVYRLVGIGGTHKSNTRGGFMGKSWDGGDIAFDPATWAALGEHMHPGAFGMAFASSRGWHRLACAIEDAGMAIHPSVFGWGFGSGFPKATRIDTQVDKAAGAERKKIANYGQGFRAQGSGLEGWQRPGHSIDQGITAPATPLAQTWAGHRYGLQALKPAIEPVIVFQKPYEGKPVESITRTGAGALWVDGGRIGIQDADNIFAKNPHTQNKAAGWVTSGGTGAAYEVPSGRWPANFALIHSPECNGECAPECAVRRLGEQSGESSSRASGYDWAASVTDNPTRVTRNIKSGQHFGDTGTAARYFFQAQWEALEAADPVYYCAKASRKERDAGLDGLPEKAGAHQYRSIRSTRGNGYDEASRARNPHPTIKPIALIKYLATLLLPPAEYGPRRILIPFAGAGSEMIGAMQAGWEEVIGIEREAEYVEIAEKRLAYWSEQHRSEVGEPDSQMSLLEAVG